MLAGSFSGKGKQYLAVVKMGRTELQDAVPMTVGQEFYPFASSLENQIQLLKDSEKSLYVENMGATAIGTGIDVPKGYPEKFAEHLSKLLNKPIVPAPNMIAATWDQQGFVDYSSALKSLAVKLSKISDDLILLTSGPRAGLNEIDLPAIQPGSSIMPGKVNPVVPEVMNLVTFRVIGNDLVVTLAAHGGQLQLNAYEPVEGLAMIESQSLLYNTSKLLRTRCVDGIVVDEQQLEHTWRRRSVSSLPSIGLLATRKRLNSRTRPTPAAGEFWRSSAGNTSSPKLRSKSCSIRPSLPTSIHRNTSSKVP